jgi:SAM-dependent methyltransferase
MAMTITNDQYSADSQGDLPSYTDMLHAYHRAREADLRAIVERLPIAPGDLVLDVASGDGCYSIWLAERAGQIIGVDMSASYIALAQSQVAASRYASRISFKRADAIALPLADNSVDLAWCAQSLFSLPEPLAVLREMARVTRPGGHIAILESDTLHQVLLPWPAELELAVRQAQLETLAAEYAQVGPNKFYIGRNLYSLFHQCGITSCTVQSYPIDICGPLSADEETFLRFYLADLRKRAWPHLSSAARAAFDMLFDPCSPAYLPRRCDFHMTHLELLAVGRKPPPH